MGMQSMSVKPAQVIQLSQSLSGGANEIQAVLDQLDQDVKKLISQWDGAAQEAYHEAQRKWSRSLTEIRELLNKIARATDTISSEYTQGDSKSASLFGG